MGLRFYCAACGKPYLFQFDTKFGRPLWIASCLCHAPLVEPRVAPGSERKAAIRTFGDALAERAAEIAEEILSRRKQ